MQRLLMKDLNILQPYYVPASKKGATLFNLA